MTTTRLGPNEPSPDQQSKPGFLQLFATIMTPTFLAFVEQTIVATALPSIGATLGDIEILPWVVIAYLLAATVSAPVYGVLGDRFGRKTMLISGLLIFIGGALVCAFAQSVPVLIGGRLLQGIGGGALMTMSHALIGEAIEPRERARFQGNIAAIAVLASTIGPVAGGFLTQYFGWQSIFFATLPIGILALLLVSRLRTQPAKREPHHFDLPGLVLLSLLIAVVFLLVQVIQDVDLEAVPLAVGLVVAALALIPLLMWREGVASNPLLPPALLRLPAIWRGDALAACHGAIIVSLITYLPIYYGVAFGASASATGLLMLPMTVGVGIGSFITGSIVSRTGRTAIFPSVGLTLVSLGIFGVAVMLPNLSAEQLSIWLGFVSLFLGTLMGVVQITVQAAAGPRMLGTAVGSVQLSRSLGAALGAALIGSIILSSSLASDLATAAAFRALLRAGTGSGGDPFAHAQMLTSGEIVSGFRLAFFAISAIGAIGALLAWTLPLRRV